MVLRFGVLTYVLTAAAPRSGIEISFQYSIGYNIENWKTRQRNSLDMSFQLSAQNYHLNTKSNTLSNISIKLHRPKRGIEHSIQYDIVTQYFNRICLLESGVAPNRINTKKGRGKKRGNNQFWQRRQKAALSSCSDEDTSLTEDTSKVR